MTTATEDQPEPRDIALEQPTPEQVEQLEATSAGADADAEED